MKATTTKITNREQLKRVRIPARHGAPRDTGSGIPAHVYGSGASVALGGSTCSRHFGFGVSIEGRLNHDGFQQNDSMPRRWTPYRIYLPDRKEKKKREKRGCRHV